MLTPERCQEIIEGKMVLGGYKYGEGWAVVDNCLIIYDFTDPPHWFPKDRDDDGNTPEYNERMKRGKEEAAASTT